MDERERLATLLAAIDGEWTTDSRGEMWYDFFADRLLRAGGSPSTGEDRLREAAQAVSDKARVVTVPSTTRPRWVIDDTTFSALRAALTPTGDTPKEAHRG